MKTKRTEKVCLWVSPEEKAELEQAAEDDKRSLSSFLRIAGQLRAAQLRGDR